MKLDAKENYIPGPATMCQHLRCGYDKLSAALGGIKWGELTFTDHPVNWEIQLRKAGYTVVQAV